MSVFVRKVGWRFMLRGTEKGTFSAMTLFAWAAIGVGVAAMSSLLSVMFGFETSLKDKVLTAYPHIWVKPPAGSRIAEPEKMTAALKQIEGLKRVEPYLDAELIAQSEHRALGSVAWGILSADMGHLQKDLSGGKLPEPGAKIPEALVGSELAGRLHLSVGDKFSLVSPLSGGGVMGAVPRSETFIVSGLYTSGHYDFDQQAVYVNLADLQDLLRAPNRLSGWHLWADSHEQGSELLPAVSEKLPQGWEAQDWSQFNSALFHSLKLEQYSMFTILLFAVVIAVMNIIITLIMNASHKRRNIGILRALGATESDIRKIFVWQGFCLGAVGVALGATLTVIFVILVKYFPIYELPEMYYDRTIPIELRPWPLVSIYLIATILIFASTLLPARRAARLDPVAAIRA